MTACGCGSARLLKKIGRRRGLSALAAADRSMISEYTIPPKNLFRNVMDYLRPKLVAGTLVVVLEPSCAAAIRDEFVNLSPEIPLRSASASKLF